MGTVPTYRSKLTKSDQISLHLSEIKASETSLVVQWLGLCLPMQGVQILSLVEKLRSHLPYAQEPKQKQKQYCNKFNKNFKNGPHQNIYIYICFRKKKELILQLPFRFLNF